MKKVLTIGGATQDFIITYDDLETLNLQSAKGEKSYLLLEEGRKIEVKDLMVYSGGGATNSAVSFKRLGFEVACFCKIGNDVIGEKISQELQAHEIDTKFITKSEILGTGCSFVIPSLRGDRTIFAYRGANADLKPEDLPVEVIKDSDLIYITSLSRDSASVFTEITRIAKQGKAIVAVNPGVSQLKLGSYFVKQALPQVDILILNDMEAKQLMLSLVKEEGTSVKLVERSKLSTKQPDLLDSTKITHEDISFSIKEFFAEILKLGPKTVVVTHGEEGVYVAHEGHIYFHPSIKAKIVNTLGAGDAFGSCFVGSLVAGHDIKTSIRRGLLNSSSVIGYIDAKTGLLTESAMQVQLQIFTHDRFQVFQL